MMTVEIESLDRCGGKQVDIHIINATTVELSRADEIHDLLVFSHTYRAQLLKQFKSCLTVREITAGELADYEQMHYDFAATETLAEFGLVLANRTSKCRCSLMRRCRLILRCRSGQC